MKRAKGIPLWQIIGIAILLGIPLLIIILDSKPEEPELLWKYTTDRDGDVFLVYYPKDNQTCFEYESDEKKAQICNEGRRTDIVEYFQKQWSENQNPIEEYLPPQPQPTNMAYSEMKNFLSLLNTHKGIAENCVSYQEKAVASQGDVNAEAYWWELFEKEDCPNLTENACKDLAPTLEKRKEAPFWWKGTESPYDGKYLTTGNYVIAYKAYKDIGCNIEDVNIPKDQLTCLEKGAKIEELKEYPEKYHVQPNPTIYNQLQWDYINTCLTDTLK